MVCVHMSAVEALLEERHALGLGLARLEVGELEELEPGAVVDADRDSPFGGRGKADEPAPHARQWLVRHEVRQTSYPKANTD